MTIIFSILMIILLNANDVISLSFNFNKFDKFCPLNLKFSTHSNNNKFIEKFDSNEFNPYNIEFPVLDKDRNGNALISQRIRPRRNRRNSIIRSLVRENTISTNNLVYPLFIYNNKNINNKGNKIAISSMPNIFRHDLISMMNEIKECVELGIKSFVLFPHIEDELKSNLASESNNINGLIPTAIKMIKNKFKDVIIITDVALDPYSNMGHDGVVEDNKILNDLTVQQLQKQAVMHARAGADIISPSDMMDGRVGAIRDALDSEGFTDVGILSYTAKYASSYYGPFRDALQSHPGFGDKKTYQMDPANSREAITEALLDIKEGADIIMVKPGMPYLDIIHKLYSKTNVPIAAYQVSGEYAMFKAAALKGWIDEKKTVTEALISFKRSGANIIFTYYAKEFAQWLRDKKISLDE